MRRLLCGLALACGVLAMHGLQVSNGPGDLSGLPSVGAAHDRHAPPPEAPAKGLAGAIITGQTAEIATMRTLLKP